MNGENVQSSYHRSGIASIEGYEGEFSICYRLFLHELDSKNDRLELTELNLFKQSSEDNINFVKFLKRFSTNFGKIHLIKREERWAVLSLNF